MTQRILFRMTQTRLLVANTGRCFSKAGLKAICYPATSSKGADITASTIDSGTPKEWVEEVVKNRVETFKREPEALQSASNMAALTAKDYSGRVFLELLQNAIDADRKEQIGHKGIGFRSVLNDSEAVEIHSGDLHVRWSENDARRALAGLSELPEKLPVLDLPAWVEPDGELMALLNDSTKLYATIVCLTIRPDGLQHVCKDWAAFSSDPSLLLFIDGEIEICWEREETRRTWKRNQDDDIVTVSVEDTAETFRKIRWRSFESGHARVAYAVNEANRFQPSGVSAPRLRSYFPANQSPHPFPNLFLHHGKFDLQSNRESVSPSDAHLGDLAQAILKAAQSTKEQSDLLDLLRVGSLEDKDTSRIDYKVWEAAGSVLKDAPFPALRGRKLADIKTCPKPEHLPPFGWHDEGRLRNWAAFLTALNQVRREGLNDLPVLEPGIENAQRETTLLKFNLDASFTDVQLQKQAWAPVEDSPEPVTSSDFKVFLPHKGEPLNPPQGIEVRFLSGALLKAFADADGSNLDSFLNHTLGVLKFSALSVIEHSVLPMLDQTQPVQPNGELIQFLKRLRDVDAKESNKPVESFDWHDKTRRKLIQELHLRCQDRSWPILQVYAGEKWTGNRFLEDFFDDNRGFLDIEPHADQEQRKLEENFWKWLGVAWCPKVLPALEAIVVEKQHGEGLAWENGRFQGRFFQMQHAPEGWTEYCRALRGDVGFTGWSYFPRLKANWTIDGGASALGQIGAFGVIAKHWPAYRGWLRAKIGYSTNAQIDHDNRSNEELCSHVAWLFQTAEWVPCAGGLHCGCNVFQPAGAVAKELTSFVPRLVLPENEAGGTQMPLQTEFLNACGIRNGWEEVNDDDWSLWLKKAAQINPESDGGNQNRDAIHGLYRKLLDHRRRKTGPRGNEAQAEALELEGIELWGIERQSDICQRWHLLKTDDPKPFFVDRADIVDVSLPGLFTFPVRLDGLSDRAVQHLGLPLLSNALSGKPNELGQEKPEFATTATDRLHELVAYLRLGNERKDDAKLQSALQFVTLRETSGLRVQFSLNSELVGMPLSRRRFPQVNKETQKWLVFVDSDCPDDERWEAFAEALLLSCELPADKASNVQKLLCCEPERLPERLTRFGVAPETAEALRKRRDERVEQPPPLPAQPPMQEVAKTAAPEVPEIIPVIPPANRSISEDELRLTKGTRGSERPDSSSERRAHLPTDGKRSPSSRPHPEEGLSAQRWLFERVKEWCEKQQQPEPVWEIDHVDITIPLSPDILIEAKRIDGSTIHWSRNQIEKAMANPGCYIVALLRPDEIGGGYKIFWVQEPLNDFLILPRWVEWIWQVQKGSSFPENSWIEPVDKPSKPANSFNAEITVHDAWLEDLPAGIEHLAQMLSVAPKP
jgi:hypothetical protein